MSPRPPERVESVRLGEVALLVRLRGEPEAPCVLLLHGGGSDSSTWGWFTERLARAGYRTIAPDLRGHGGSDRAPKAAAYSLSDYARDAARLLDHYDVAHCDLIGHSLGGHAAVALAGGSGPGRVRRLVCEDPPVPPRVPGDRRTGLVPLLALGATLARRNDAYDPRALVAAGRELRRLDPDWWRAAAEVARQGIPALVIGGGPRSYIDQLGLARLAGVLRAESVTLPVGHRVHTLDSAGFAAAVEGFLGIG